MAAHIEPLSLKAFRQVLTSHTLNPSTCVPRRVVGADSIAQTILQQQIDICQWEKRRWRWVSAPFQIVGRAVAGLAIGLIVAPVGMIYNLGKTTQHLYLHLRPGVDAQHNWQRVRDYAQALLIDFSISFLSYAGILMSTFILIGETFPYIITALALPMFNIIPIATACSALQIGYEYPNDLRIKAQLLRDEFGVVDLQGEPLRTAAADIETPDYQGLFAREWQRQGEQLLRFVQEVNAQIPANLRIPYEYPPNGHRIAKFLDQHYHALCHHIVDVIVFQRILDFRKLQENLDKLHESLRVCLMRHGHVHQDMVWNRVPQDFPFPENSYSTFHSGQVPAAIQPFAQAGWYSYYRR